MRRRHGLFLEPGLVTPADRCVVVLAGRSDVARLVAATAGEAGWRAVAPLADEPVARVLTVYRPMVVMVEDCAAFGADAISGLRGAGFTGRVIALGGPAVGDEQGCRDGGADEYVVGPLTAAALRNNLEVESIKGRAAVTSASVTQAVESVRGLRPMEARLLAYLADRSGRAVSYAEVALEVSDAERRVAETSEGCRSTIRWQVSRLRAQLVAQAAPLSIRRVPGVGYRREVATQ